MYNINGKYCGATIHGTLVDSRDVTHWCNIKLDNVED